MVKTLVLETINDWLADCEKRHPDLSRKKPELLTFFNNTFLKIQMMNPHYSAEDVARGYS